LSKKNRPSASGDDFFGMFSSANTRRPALHASFPKICFAERRVRGMGNLLTDPRRRCRDGCEKSALQVIGFQGTVWLKIPSPWNFSSHGWAFFFVRNFLHRKRWEGVSAGLRRGVRELCPKGRFAALVLHELNAKVFEESRIFARGTEIEGLFSKLDFSENGLVTFTG